MILGRNSDLIKTCGQSFVKDMCPKPIQVNSGNDIILAKEFSKLIVHKTKEVTNLF